MFHGRATPGALLLLDSLLLDFEKLNEASPSLCESKGAHLREVGPPLRLPWRPQGPPLLKLFSKKSPMPVG